MRVAHIILAAVVIGVLASAQSPTAGSPFTDPELGFRYTPPGGLRDFTAVDRQSVRRRAAALRTTKVLDVRLSLQSPSEDTAPDWHQIGIETYPREKLADLDDQTAIRKVSRWVAGVGTEEGEPRQAKIGVFHFTVSAFELQEGQLVKHASVYTTILKRQVVSFAFSANSRDVLMNIETSINSVEPLPPR